MAIKTTTAMMVALLAAAAAAMEARPETGAWTITLPDTWTHLPAEAYDRFGPGVHSVWSGPEQENRMRDVLVVSVQEETLHVSAAKQEEFRAAQQEGIKKSLQGVDMGIEDVKVVRLGDREVYRVEAHLVAKQAPPLKILKYFVPAGEKTYVFSFQTPASDYAYKVVVFETMAQSIRMREAAPAAPGAEADWSGIVTAGGIAVAALCALGMVVLARRQFRTAAEP